MISPRTRGRGSRAESHVAKLYMKGGFRVIRNKKSRAGEVDIIARRGKKEKYIVEVKSGNQTITASDIEKIYHKARYHKGISVLRIGPNVRLTSRAKRLARNLGVRVKRYKY